MSRTYFAGSLVQLPRVDYNGAIALASAVEAVAAKDGNLPPNITEVVVQITTDRTVLQQAAAKAPGGVLTVKEADRREDRVGGAFHDIFQAWASLAEFIPEGATAQLVMDRLFADGRRFVNLKVQEEWAAVETKLATIERENLGPHIDAVGAGPVLKLLKDVHATYGAVIGTTEPLAEAPEVRQSKDDLMDSLRDYVVQVASTVRRGKPETAARAEVLMKPILEWVSTKPHKDKPEPPKAPPTAAPSADEGKSGG